MRAAIVLAMALGLAAQGFAARGRPRRLAHLARPRRRPEGAPRASDVIMRSLRLRPTGPEDPHDTWEALQRFHVTRLEWAYINDPAFIKRVTDSGRVFGGAASAPSYDRDIRDDAVYEAVVVQDASGRPIVAPWKRKWKRTLWGCVNNPELERGYLATLKRYVDAGARVMHRDEPRANSLSTRWGGCFCEHCIEAFRGYLAEHTSAGQREALGIGDPAVFDYRAYVTRRERPSRELRRLFGKFQEASTLAFHRRTRAALDADAGRRVPMSCNNGVHRFGRIENAFDWYFGELAHSNARPEFILAAVRRARDHGRLQVMSMPKKGNTRDPQAWQRLTRRTIATAYAAGGHCMVPWDVYMPSNAPRYFGTAEQYADLYGFVRASAAWLDRYEEAAVFGPASGEARGGPSPVGVEGGSGRVWAFARAVPGRPEGPIAVHLVEWGEPREATLVVAASAVGGSVVRARLGVPAPFDAEAHARAEASGDYAALRREVRVRSAAGTDAVRFAIPPLEPWGVLVVEPSAP